MVRKNHRIIMSNSYFCDLRRMELSDPNCPKLFYGYNEKEIVDLINQRYRYYETVVLKRLRENKIKPKR